MKEWYEDMLHDLNDLGEEGFLEEVEEGMYPEEARELLVKRSALATWPQYELILKIFTHVYR